MRILCICVYVYAWRVWVYYNRLEKKTRTSVCVNNSIRALRIVHSVLLTLPSLQIDSGSLEMPKKMTASDWTICLFLMGSVTEVKDYLPHHFYKHL